MATTSPGPYGTMTVTDRCSGGREAGKTSDKLEQDHSSFEGGWAGAHTLSPLQGNDSTPGRLQITFLQLNSTPHKNADPAARRHSLTPSGDQNRTSDRGGRLEILVCRRRRRRRERQNDARISKAGASKSSCRAGRETTPEVPQEEVVVIIIRGRKQCEERAVINVTHPLQDRFGDG